MAKAKNRRPSSPMAQPVLAGNAVAADEPAKKRPSPAQFFSQVRAEAKKIVWPSRKETWITSVMVFIMVLIATVFFFVVDMGLAEISKRLLALGS